ncbi:hypothetical protein CYMTET_28524 [Cymbomonas tetramitiformis]|uniref:Uncharacterized protein n=1 Tax=Cymbomonas tetramitiformis TaxID=36881 RepID=A0AAE0FMR4_9CHLO|nr:hypothetical protein CYMTET_28524 [Cymbomonas tetramitiformis]
MRRFACSLIQSTELYTFFNTRLHPTAPILCRASTERSFSQCQRTARCSFSQGQRTVRCLPALQSLGHYAGTSLKEVVHPQEVAAHQFFSSLLKPLPLMCQERSGQGRDDGQWHFIKTRPWLVVQLHLANT